MSGQQVSMLQAQYNPTGGVSQQQSIAPHMQPFQAQPFQAPQGFPMPNAQAARWETRPANTMVAPMQWQNSPVIQQAPPKVLRKPTALVRSTSSNSGDH